MLNDTVGEVERISRELRPSLLDQLGLVAAIKALSTEFTDRTGVEAKLTGMQLPAPRADIELALYRIMQEALKNVERHAAAKHVTVSLTQKDSVVQLVVRDDGRGFDIRRHESRNDQMIALGLLGMRERAAAAGGTLAVMSAPRAGTKVIARIPVRGPTPPVPFSSRVVNLARWRR
jgi:two-component system NarL family sensor kinase